MDNRGMLWSAAEIEQLKEEINKRMSVDDIATAHGRTPYGIVGKMQTLGWLFLKGRAYHLVEPDPWTFIEMVKAAQDASGK